MYEYVVKGPEFMLNGRDRKVGDVVAGDEAKQVEAEPGLMKRVVRRAAVQEAKPPVQPDTRDRMALPG